MKRLWTALLLSGLWGTAHPLPVVLVDTLSSLSLGGPFVSGGVLLPGVAAGSFNTGSTAVSLTSVSLPIGFGDLGLGGPPGDASGTGLSVELYQSIARGSVSGFLGQLSFTGTLPPVGVGPSTVFTPSSPIPLTANSRYWVVATSQITSYYIWRQASVFDPSTVMAVGSDTGNFSVLDGSSIFPTSPGIRVVADDAAAAPELDLASQQVPWAVMLTSLALVRTRRRRAPA